MKIMMAIDDERRRQALSQPGVDRKSEVSAQDHTGQTSQARCFR